MLIGGVHCPQANLAMNGLRVYINSETVETISGRQVFYSRREDGPYYRWAYDEKLRRWRVGRVLTSGISPRMLALAAWKAIPVGLQKSMAEHYQD